ncbi:MAG TPA: hypothetical protein VFV99_17675 [Kofleriaceae bacterium]|nr:hypothetical protein [Kofleriaceae bacterium]
MGSSETLRSVIDAGRSSKRLDELSSARVIGKIAQQIHAAQQKAGAGKAVGPITPANIKLAANGETKLELGASAGSLGYSSPEQTMGGFGDRRSDVFSLGTVLWEALTYQRLFDAMNDAAVRMAVQEREISPPSEVNANIPAELSAICMRALNRNSTDRYQSLKAMAVEIEEFLEEAGYADDDSKIAAYLATMNDAPKAVKIEMAPLARPASSTQPPPSTLTPPSTTKPPVEKSASGTQPPANVMKPPAAPSMLGEAPKSTPAKPAGHALAAALANAGATPATSNGSTTTAAASTTGTSLGLPPINPSTTAVGVPKADDWQDSSKKADAPLSPLPPVLPSGSTPLRNDRSTIAVSVPPQVKVATVEAKHAEAKQPAMIVDDKPAAQIVEDVKATIVDSKPPAMIVDDGKATLVDSKPPEIVVPKLVDGKLPSAVEQKPEPVKQSAVETKPVAAVTPAAAETKPAVETKPADTKRAASEAEKKPEGRKRAPSQAGGRKRPPSQGELPQAAAAVSLPGGGRDSKDVLAGWGWGTDKHNAIAPDDYPHDDDYDFHEPNSRKMLVKIIGAGMGVVALIIIVAFAFGGSSDKKKTSAAKQADTTKPLVEQPPAPPPEAAPVAQPAAGSADPAPGSADGSAVAAAQPTEPAQTEEQKAEAAKAEAAAAEAAKAEAAKAEADRIAAEKEQAKQAEVAKAEAAKQEAARIAAEKEQAKQADAAKKETAKQEAARIAAEKKAEAARVAAEKAEAKKAEQARIAEAKKAQAEARKAEAARIAAEKAEAKKTQAAAAKTTPKARPEKKQPKAETKVAKAEPKTETKVDGDTAYRQGLQLFARGDTSGALASLRTALAANPNHAPTWRGLGLVFEKMGEKDQARVAYKRYLQLAPGAGDAEQIKGRLERLQP